MFDFNTRRDVCIQGMKTAYHVGMYGNDPKVLDGTWKAAFDDSAEGPTAGTQGGPGGLDSWEDADGTEEDHRQHDNDQHAAPPSRSHKREHSQSKLDFGKKKAKKSE